MDILWYIAFILALNYSCSEETTRADNVSAGSFFNISVILDTLFATPRIQKVCKPDRHATNAFYNTKILHRAVAQQCISKTFGFATPDDSPQDVLKKLNYICMNIKEILECLKSTLLKPMHKCANTRGSAYEGALIKISLDSLTFFCATELERLSSVEDGRVQKCVNAEFKKIHKCAVEFSSVVYIRTEPEGKGVRSICRNISQFFNCLKNAVDNCGIYELSAIAERVKWEIATNIDCDGQFYGNDSLQYAGSRDRYAPRNYLSPMDAVGILEGDAEAMDENSISFYMARHFTTQYRSLWEDCQAATSHEEAEIIRAMNEDVQITHKCISAFLKQVLSEEEMQEPLNPILMINNVCRYPRTVIQCFEVAYRRLANCHDENYRTRVKYAGKLLKEFFYVICVAEKQAWQSVDWPILNNCLGKQSHKLKRCALEFERKFSTFGLAAMSNLDEKDFCFHSWELLECLEDQLTTCALGLLTGQLRPIKLALADRLYCGYPYQPQALARMVTKIIEMDLKNFEILKLEKNDSLDSCNVESNCRIVQLYNRVRETERMTKEMNKKMDAAKAQLSNLLASMDNPPTMEFGSLLEFLNGDYFGFYKTMFQYCPSERPEKKIAYVESVVNSTVSCFFRRLIEASPGNSNFSLSVSATVKGLCSKMNASIWQCFTDRVHTLNHCFTTRARYLIFVASRLHNVSQSLICENINLFWQDTSDETVDNCLVEQGNHLWNCVLGFIGESLRTLRVGELKIKCLNVVKLLECLEDGISACGNRRLSWNFAKLKGLAFLRLDCMHSHKLSFQWLDPDRKYQKKAHLAAKSSRYQGKISNNNPRRRHVGPYTPLRRVKRVYADV